jgi:hypothetical protein
LSLATEWRRIEAGEIIRCPDMKRADRRHAYRGDRRNPERMVPCEHRLGRAGSVAVYIRRPIQGQRPAPFPSHYVHCEDCGRSVEVMTAASDEAA